MTSAPILNYFPAAGRGELARLVSAAGGVDIVDTFPGLKFKEKVGWFGSMPQVTHGTFTLCQTAAVQQYFAALSQKWKVLTPQQVAVDNMFAAYCEDLRVAGYKVAFGDADAKAGAKDTLPPAWDKILSVLEQMVPQGGFINGHDFPTTADMVLVNFAEAAGPFRDVLKFTGDYNWQDKYPKIKANVDRSLAVAEVQTYIRSSGTLKNGGVKLYAGVLGSELGHAVSFGCLRARSLQYEPPTGPARAPSSIGQGEVIQLVYFPIAGRGELCRLLAAVGGVSLEDQAPPEDQSHKKKFTGTLPQMKHGDFELTQSGAIESYIAAIAPKFQGLTSQQRAIDDCYAATKEDILQGMVPVVFGQGEAKEAALAKLPSLLDKFLSVLEENAPEQGFTHGLDFPTGADLTLMIITSAGAPFQVCYQAASYDWQSKFPKIKALVERTQAVPEVKEYLSSSKTFGATSLSA